MKTTPLLGLVLMLAVQLSAFGQGFAQPLSDQPSRDQNVMLGLLKIVTAQPDIQSEQGGNKLDFAPTASRGGPGALHPHLGCYIGSPGDLEFRSDYKNLDAQTMAAWAYDLHQQIINAGGGYENCLRYQKEHSTDRSMIPYAKLHEWTQTYWDQHSEKFRHMASMFRDWWTNDAILDGMTIYLEYQQRNGYDNTDFIGYKGATLAKLMKKE